MGEVLKPDLCVVGAGSGGLSVAAIAASPREALLDLAGGTGDIAFRALERDAVRVALEEHDGVLALGGGAVLDESTQELLTAYGAGGGTIVFLDVTLAHAAPRVGFNQARPLLLGNPRAQWQALMEARRPVYERLATVRVLTDAHRPADVAELIEQELAVLRRGEGTPS